MKWEGGLYLNIRLVISIQPQICVDMVIFQNLGDKEGEGIYSSAKFDS